MSEISSFFPQEFFPIGLTLILSFLIGLEREEHKGEKGHGYSFGGVRTFPLIGLSGYVFARISNGSPIVLGIGFLTIGALLWLSYKKKLEISSHAGLTSEVSGLFTFLLGAMIFQKSYWASTTLAVVALLLLELKVTLEHLAKRIPSYEIYTFTTFLLLSAVILPIIPNQEFTEFHLNPYNTWRIVVAISSVSYLAYGIGRLYGANRGVIFAAIVGGLYSSTVTTISLSRGSRKIKEPYLFSGGMLMASGLMYFRVTVLIYLFNTELARRVAAPFLLLGFCGFLVGWFWAKRGNHTVGYLQVVRNPLELHAAVIFAGVFVAMTVITQIVHSELGHHGLYALAMLMGVTDVDPFIMTLSQIAGSEAWLKGASIALIIATASNNLVKGIYGFTLAGAVTRRMALILLSGFAALGFLSILYLA